MSRQPLRAAARWGWFGALVVCAGCASAPRSAHSSPETGTSRASTITVVVENNLWNDVVVYSESSAGARVRLGTVNTGIPTRFRIPTNQASAPNLRLTADPIGSNQLRQTENIMAEPGQVVRWTIMQREVFSQLIVR